MTYQLLNVPGAQRTSAKFRTNFAKMVGKHNWDGDAIAAVISNESGFDPSAKNPLPGQSAVGLLQFIGSTLKSLGYNGTRDQFASLKDWEQLVYVEQYYQRALGDGKHRPVDYYLATWGSKPGRDYADVLAASGSKEYDLNKGLDTDGDGSITVEDLAMKVQRIEEKSSGNRLELPKPQTHTLKVLTVGAGVALLGYAAKKYFFSKPKKSNATDASEPGEPEVLGPIGASGAGSK